MKPKKQPYFSNMLREITAFLDKKCISRGFGIFVVLACYAILVALWYVGNSYSRYLAAMDYEATHMFYRQVLHDYKYGLAIAPLKLTDEQKARRAKNLLADEKALGISDEEVSGRRVKALRWNYQFDYPYWDYLPKDQPAKK